MQIDWLIVVKAAILGIVQGLTEFLPISSTGHLILFNDLLGTDDAKWKAFDIFVQFGSILAVVWACWGRLWPRTMGLLKRDPAAWGFWWRIGIAFLPAAVVGLLCHDFIEEKLFTPFTVMLAQFLGGVIILVAERWYRQHQEAHPDAAVTSVDAMRWPAALKVGLAQVLSLFPGMSRSGSTIIGGMFFGLSRQTATEFTFFLAIPVLGAASAYSLLKALNKGILERSDALPFAIGFVAAFFSSLLVVKWLLRFVAHHDFRVFAWYRIGLAGVILVHILLSR